MALETNGAVFPSAPHANEQDEVTLPGRPRRARLACLPRRIPTPGPVP